MPVEGKEILGFEDLDVGNRIRVELIGTDIERGLIDLSGSGTRSSRSVMGYFCHLVRRFLQRVGDVGRQVDCPVLTGWPGSFTPDEVSPD